MIAKLVSPYIPADEVGPSPEQLAVYELFDIETAQDISDRDVQIRKSIGRFTLEELQIQLAKLQEKIDAINLIKEEV